MNLVNPGCELVKRSHRKHVYTVLFASPYSQEGKYVHTLIFATTSAGYSCGVALLSLYQCCISGLLVEFFDLIVLLCYSFGLRLPHIAYISAASVISVCRFYTNV